MEQPIIGRIGQIAYTTPMPSTAPISNDRSSENRTEKFKVLCAPLVELIQKEYGMHARIIIEWDSAVLVTDEMGASFKVPD